MARLMRAMVLVLALLVAGLTAGFYVFTNAVRGFVATTLPTADAVVVLTGGEARIAAGLELLAAGRGRRLLVTGVNRAIPTPIDLARHVGGRETLFRCCVDIDHQALDTVGNAEEALRWAASYGFESLVVVTSAYHMPRSLAEFSIAMPHVKLVAHPVPSRHYRIDDWWRHPSTARLLASEYVKFLASSVRLGLARITNSLDQPALAGRRSGPPNASPI